MKKPRLENKEKYHLGPQKKKNPLIYVLRKNIFGPLKKCPWSLKNPLKNNPYFIFKVLNCPTPSPPRLCNLPLVLWHLLLALLHNDVATRFRFVFFFLSTLLCEMKCISKHHNFLLGVDEQPTNQTYICQYFEVSIFSWQV